MIQIMAVSGLGEVEDGAQLSRILGAALADMAPEASPEAGDVLVVTQKIVSKAERRRVSLSSVSPGARALKVAGITLKDPRLVELALAEATDVVRAAPHVLITRHKLGLVMANSGIDASNIGTGIADEVLLLPEDPDTSAGRLRAELAQQFGGVELGIIISDSFGRPWRHGVTNVAIGAAGLPAIHDMRGGMDRDGRVLQVTQIAYGDLLASAAGLAMGEGAEGIPAVLVKGCVMPNGDVPACALVRPVAEDLFR